MRRNPNNRFLVKPKKTARNLVNKLTNPKSSIDDHNLAKSVASSNAKGSSLRIYSNTPEALKILEQRIAKLENLGTFFGFQVSVSNFIF